MVVEQTLAWNRKKLDSWPAMMAGLSRELHTLNINLRLTLKECLQRINFLSCKERKTWWSCANLQTLHQTLRVKTLQQLIPNLEQLGSRNISPIIIYKATNSCDILKTAAIKQDALVVKIKLRSDMWRLPNKTACSDLTHGMYKVVSRPSAWTVSTKND